MPGGASGSQPFTFVQLCDPQLGMGGYEHDLQTFQQAVAQINSLKAEFVVICGDLVHDANEQSFADFRRVRAAVEIPCHCVPGNHDVGGTPTRASLERYRRVIGNDYYSLEHKGCVFAFVNTQLWKSPVDGESEKQDAWLEQILERAATKRARVFIVGHYPLFIEKPDEPEEYMNLPLAKRAELLSLFERCGVVAGTRRPHASSGRQRLQGHAIGERRNHEQELRQTPVGVPRVADHGLPAVPA